VNFFFFFCFSLCPTSSSPFALTTNLHHYTYTSWHIQQTDETHLLRPENRRHCVIEIPRLRLLCHFAGSSLPSSLVSFFTGASNELWFLATAHPSLEFPWIRVRASVQSKWVCPFLLFTSNLFFSFPFFIFISVGTRYETQHRTFYNVIGIFLFPCGRPSSFPFPFLPHRATVRMGPTGKSFYWQKMSCILPESARTSHTHATYPRNLAVELFGRERNLDRGVRNRREKSPGGCCTQARVLGQSRKKKDNRSFFGTHTPHHRIVLCLLLDLVARLYYGRPPPVSAP
jgi:hypothetical protein